MFLGFLSVLAVTAFTWFAGTVLDGCSGAAYSRGGGSFRWLLRFNPHLLYGTIRILPIVYAVRVVAALYESRRMFLLGTIGACLGPMTGIYTHVVSDPWWGARLSADDWQIIGVGAASIAVILVFFWQENSNPHRLDENRPQT